MIFINRSAKTNAIIAKRRVNNQRQLAESVRNKLKNMLKNVCPTNTDLLFDLEEMYGDMEQLNLLRIRNNTW